MQQTDFDFKLHVQSLVNGKTVQVSVHNDIHYENLLANPSESLWSLLYYAGYLTTDLNSNSLVRIPNLEVKTEWNKWLSILSSSQFATASSLLDLLLNGDAEKFANKFSSTLQSCLSYFEVGGSTSSKNSEAYYHSFCLGLFSNAIGRGCHITSERPAGKGRYDVLVLPPLRQSSQFYAAIIEFKIVYTSEELKKKAEAGLKQIDDNVYRACLPPSFTKLLEVGIAFEGNSSHVVYRKLHKVNDSWVVIG